MAKVLKATDAVIVGLGWTGAIMARELTRAGLEVLALERGPDRDPAADFELPAIRDELRYSVRQELMQDPKMETVTLRHRLDDEARPVRRFGAFLPGDGVGGMGTHWNGNTFRFLPSDHNLRTHLTERYGRGRIPDDMTIQDWGVTYDELEPHYARFEAICGVSGKAGNIRGRIQAGGNPFEGPRSGEYPNAPLVSSHANELFSRAATELGLHPFPAPASNSSAPYRNPEGAQLGACQYCGHCDRFGCEANAKATPLSTLALALGKAPGFRKVTNAYATRVLYDAQTRRATGVRYIDLRSGETYDQPAEIVILSAWVFGNTRLMLLSGIGQPYDPRTGTGVVGKNYCYQIQPTLQLFFEAEELNPFMGAGGLGMVVDDFNGDNFDHANLGFLGGGYISLNSTNGRPISFRPTPPGTPTWGAAWKRGDREMVPQDRDGALRGHELRIAHQFDGSRSDVSRHVRSAAAADDVQLHAERSCDGRLSTGQSCRDRSRDECDHRRAAAAQGRFQRRLLSVESQQRWHDHGALAHRQRGEPLSAELGRAQSVRAGIIGLPAKRRLQPDRRGRSYRLLVRGCAGEDLPQISRSDGATVTTRWMTGPGLAALLFGMTANAPIAAADIVAGKALFEQCAACHGASGDGTEQGPSLHGVVGRKAGQMQNFRYSRAMQRSGIVWSEETLARYLSDPQDVVPGNRMPFGGLATPEESKDVVSYLESLK
ncbi:choline dehydrogenase-like flavoprotein [Bradyrhizobium sp. USDA 4472]